MEEIEERQRLWERVNFALSYPFVAPMRDYVYFRDHALEIVECPSPDPTGWRVDYGHETHLLGPILEEFGVNAAPLSELTPVVASGSNASPLQLNRKFYDLEPELCPCFRIRLPGFEACYAAHIAHYGSIPASLERTGEGAGEFVVSFLPEAYLARVNATESLGRYYNLLEIDDIALERPGLSWRSGALGYSSATGLVLDETGRRPLRLTENDQWRAQSAVIRHLGERRSVQNFVRENILDQKGRLLRERELARRMREYAGR